MNTNDISEATENVAKEQQKSTGSLGLISQYASSSEDDEDSTTDDKSDDSDKSFSKTNDSNNENEEESSNAKSIDGIKTLVENIVNNEEPKSTENYRDVASSES